MTLFFSDTLPRLVVANARGEIIDCPEFAMLGRAGQAPELPDHLIPLPNGSSLYTLPGRLPIGFDKEMKGPVTLELYLDEPVQAVAAFVAPAYTQLLRPAFELTDGAPRLPLYCYTAIGWKEDQFWVPAMRVDESTRQDADQFDEKRVTESAYSLIEQYPHNRLVQHLMENCCLLYRCPAARNFALGRWEMPLPTSRACNSRCIGCISLQPGDDVCAAQERIAFTPTPEEIVEIVVPHFENADQPIASFGQGCEGEPLTECATLEKAISLVRAKTSKGTINLNTNASCPDKIARLLDAGLDSIRVSLNSARPEFYERYFRPVDYQFDDVIESIRIARSRGKWVSLNYFVFPGFTDQKEEWQALQSLLHDPGVDMIQWRNLNIDPDWYIEEMSIDLTAPRLGVHCVIEQARQTFPEVRFGYFNPFGSTLSPHQRDFSFLTSIRSSL